MWPSLSGKSPETLLKVSPLRWEAVSSSLAGDALPLSLASPPRRGDEVTKSLLFCCRAKRGNLNVNVGRFKLPLFGNLGR